MTVVSLEWRASAPASFCATNRGDLCWYSDFDDFDQAILTRTSPDLAKTGYERRFDWLGFGGDRGFEAGRVEGGTASSEESGGSEGTLAFDDSEHIDPNVTAHRSSVSTDEYSPIAAASPMSRFMVDSASVNV